MLELIGGAGGLGWVVVKAVLMFAVAVLSFATGAVATVTLLVVHRLVAFARRHSYETRGVTTVIGADGEPGPLMRAGLSAAGLAPPAPGAANVTHSSDVDSGAG